MLKWQKIKLFLSKGVRISKWMKYLSSAVVGYEQIKGKRVRYITFRKANATFGPQGSVWLLLPEFRETLCCFPNTLQIIGARNRVLENNIFLCLRCFALSGRMLGEPQGVTRSSLKAEFACTNEGCTEKWTRGW